MNIYIACALTHVPRLLFKEYSNWVYEVSSYLSSEHDVKFALKNSDPQLSEWPENEKAHLCYKWDREMVEKADLIIAEVSFPSTGLGIELQIAESMKIPLILCYKDYMINKADHVTYVDQSQRKHDLQIGDGYISLMALGLPNVLKVIFYGDIVESRDELVKLISGLR